MIVLNDGITSRPPFIKQVHAVRTAVARDSVRHLIKGFCDPRTVRSA